MPELPEVETVRRTLEARVLGRRVARALIHRADFVDVFPPVTRGIAKRLLEGGVLKRTARVGKQFAIEAEDGRAICVQLGMSGQVLVVPPNGERPKDHVHLEWVLDDGSRVAFRDPRRFGGVRAYRSMAELRELAWAGLGPDALTVDASHLVQACKGSKRAIKAVLLDQAVLAGVGNIYADEALFLATLRPTRRASGIPVETLERLAGAVRTTLEAAVKARGSSVRDYRDAEGGQGEAQLAHAVYGRGGSPCVACGTRLKHAQVAQRTTVWCSSCQT